MKYFISKRVCFENGIRPAGILINEEKILKVVMENYTQFGKSGDVQVIDYGNNVLMPGIIDSHVHVNEPGRTDWEGYLTATKAAAAGGVTTIVDMPLNSIPPTTTLDNLETKQEATSGQIFVDVAFWGGLISGNQEHLINLIEAGVVGFKCFMCPSGVDEFPFVDEDEIKKAVNVLENCDTVLAFHAEKEESIDVSNEDPTKYSTFLKTRPAEMEVRAIETILNLCMNHNLKCHIVHLSAADALPLIKRAKENGCQLTVETCHHYLSLTAEEVPDRATEFKCCPPIRDAANRDKLWKALSEGLIDLVVSDHSPCTPDLKCFESGNFLKAWGGISSLQFGLSLFWTQAQSRGFTIPDISKYMTRAPAKLSGLHNRKGKLVEGFDADFVIWDPETEIDINEAMIFHKNKVTPYLGKKLYGKVLETIVRGRIVYKNGSHSEEASGILLKKNDK